MAIPLSFAFVLVTAGTVRRNVHELFYPTHESGARFSVFW